MAADLEPEEALERKSTELSRWLRAESGRWADIVEIDAPCPQCGSPVVCGYADTGGSAHVHTFAHVCRSAACIWCDEHSESSTSADPLACFFCGREA